MFSSESYYVLQEFEMINTEIFFQNYLVDKYSFHN